MLRWIGRLRAIFLGHYYGRHVDRKVGRMLVGVVVVEMAAGGFSSALSLSLELARGSDVSPLDIDRHVARDKNPEGYWLAISLCTNYSGLIHNDIHLRRI